MKLRNGSTNKKSRACMKLINSSTNKAHCFRGVVKCNTECAEIYSIYFHSPARRFEALRFGAALLPPLGC